MLSAQDLSNLGMILKSENPPCAFPVTGVQSWKGTSTAAQVDRGDQAVNFQALRGKVTLLEFWAPWCPACQQAMPHTIDLQKDQRNKDRGLQVVSVSQLYPGDTEDQLKKMDAYIKENNLPFPVGIVSAGDSTSKINYGIQGIPLAVLIDRDGKIRWSGDPRGGTMDVVLENMLSDSPPASTLSLCSSNTVFTGSAPAITNTVDRVFAPEGTGSVFTPSGALFTPAKDPAGPL